MVKKLVIEIAEDGEFVWGGLMNPELFTTLIEYADKLSDESFEQK